MLSALLVIVCASSKQPAGDKVAMVQSVLRAPKLQLHYFSKYLRGPSKVRIVSKLLEPGSVLYLFEERFRTSSNISAKIQESGLYISLDSVKIIGNRGYVYGKFPVQGVVIEAEPVFTHGRWIAAEERIGIAKMD